MSKLKYLFEAVYKDGTRFVQPEHDTSAKDATKSSFYDIDHDNLVKFYLVSVDENEPQQVFAVDLVAGCFEINGVTVFMHDDRTLTDFRLVYFRRNRHSFNVHNEEIGHEVTYRLGWQTTKDDVNHKQIMEFE